jgi:serine/threonine protein kinase
LPQRLDFHRRLRSGGPRCFAPGADKLNKAKLSIESKLRPQQEKLFSLMSKHQIGDLLSEAQILTATGWKATTLDTYYRKNVLDPFLARIDGGAFKVLRSGTALSRKELAAAFSQVKPGVLQLTQGMRLTGAKEKYELVSPIGNGAVGNVWKARTSRLSLCAIKIMQPRADLLDPKHLLDIRKRFAREGKLALNLTHPNVIVHLDDGEVSGVPFIVMELSEESVESLLRQKGPLSGEAAIRIIVECLKGLRYLHEKKCIHRDVKPANILRVNARFVLGDLGIVLWSDMNPAFTSAGTITRASMQLGSWHYMSPEQRNSAHEVTSRTDIYALGITWYEMLTGRTLDPAQVAARRYPPATSDGKVSAILDKMLSYDAGDRPSAEELLVQLAQEDGETV